VGFLVERQGFADFFGGVCFEAEYVVDQRHVVYDYCVGEREEEVAEFFGFDDSVLDECHV